MYIMQRYYRKDCTNASGFYTKNISIISSDLANICIVDNSPAACRLYPENVIPITTWLGDNNDTALLDLLPFLDALRFTSDLRSITKKTRFGHSLEANGTCTSQYLF
uniref:Mitochondrial import inner membrane translocase subunit TIM50 n=1 Tax=Myxobolus squamalis TaxID=59785 RepID=A0A6B2G158_MYXSQ